MGVKINDGRIKPRREASFGKKPYTGKNRNRKGSKLKTNRLKPKAAKIQSRNPLILRDFYVYMRDLANSMGCDAHHWMPKSKLKQDIFLALVPYDEHRAIHAEGNSQSPWQWAEAQGIKYLVKNSISYFEKWAIDNNLVAEYFQLIEDLKNNPLDCHNIARNFILNNRSLDLHQGL